jgi:phosphoenolpyruvate-protein kinase (PTS system EI component)
VAETGSVLSHLAILAREAGVATVVGYAGAKDDLAEGVVVSVDGDTGQVTIQESEQAQRAHADRASASEPGGDGVRGRSPRETEEPVS